MKILLPPSEGKTAPAGEKHPDLSALSFPELNPLREKLIAALMRLSREKDAAHLLHAGAKAESMVAAQANLMSLPCAEAIRIYTGVLYKAIGYDSMKISEREFADTHLLIFSGLFGILRPSDFIPAYRLPMGIALPEIGSNKTLWKNALKDFPLPCGNLIVDCRSESYKVWTPEKSSDSPQIVQVGAVAENPRTGSRKVVSHRAKHYRGLLTRSIIAAHTELDSAAELAGFSQTLIGQGALRSVELHQITQRTFRLTLIGSAH